MNQEERALTVECPRCRAKPQQRCTRVNGTAESSMILAHPHPERVDKGKLEAMGDA